MSVPRGIRRLPSGRYQVRYTDPAGNRVTAPGTFRTQTAATDWLAETSTAMRAGGYVDPRAGRITLSDWHARWSSGRGVRSSTAAAERSWWSRWIEPELGDRALSSITPLELDAWLARIRAAGAGESTVEHSFGLVRKMLRAATRAEVIVRNPADGLSVRTPEPAPQRILERDEIDALAIAIDPRFRALVRTLALTGLRIGEAGALRVERLDMLGRRLRVEETLAEVAGHVTFGPPKTTAGRRTIALPRFVVDEIAEHLARFRADAGRRDLVFTMPNGGPLRPGLFRRRFWAPAVVAAELEPPTPTPHDLRHSHAAMLVAAGAHPKAIQVRLGHAAIGTTLDTYGHLFPGLDDELAARLDESSWARSGHAADPTVAAEES
ncbi:MAG: tyrosine-type recombinase/integrase [Gemmatimonadota bacterium]